MNARNVAIKGAFDCRGLFKCSIFVLICDMPRFEPDPTQISDAILAAPGWARVGITMPCERLRERAAHELACSIVEQITGGPSPHPDQLKLPI